MAQTGAATVCRQGKKLVSGAQLPEPLPKGDRAQHEAQEEEGTEGGGDTRQAAGRSKTGRTSAGPGMLGDGEILVPQRRPISGSDRKAWPLPVDNEK